MVQSTRRVEPYIPAYQTLDHLGSKKKVGMFSWIALTMGVTALALGLFLGSVSLEEIRQSQSYKKLQASFLLQEKEKKEKKKPVIKKKKVIKKPKVQKKPEVETPKKVVEKHPQPKKKVRKVYGLKKVFSKGLGSGASGADAVVSKLGNSMDVPPDTIQARPEDLQGKVVSVTTIKQMPRIQKASKPKYTDAMKDAAVSGKVKARVLVDTDGFAKKIIILKDLGFGTKQASIDAIRKMKFAPAQGDKGPVAVWIPLTFRFELQT